MELMNTCHLIVLCVSSDELTNKR